MANKEPNFLIFMVDQLTGTLFDEDGPANFLNVPNLRGLSAEAVNFTNTYCASPLCAPSRASFMSSLLPSKTGVYDNAAEFPSSIPTFAHHLRNLNYQTILSGKMHFVGPDQLHGFEKRTTTDVYPADFGWTPDWTKPNERIDWWYHNLSSVTTAGIAETTNQMEYDDEVAFHAKQVLHQLSRDRSKPFCLTVSFTHPHDPFVTRQKYWDLYPDGDLPNLNTSKISYDAQDMHSKRLFDMSDWKNFDITDQNVANARRAYFGNISYVDDLIGSVLETLAACEFDDNTIILFVSDHGDMLGERGLWFKMSFFEGSSRVPLFIHAPKHFSAASIAEPSSTLDVFPTLVELAGGKVPNDLDGVSLVPAMSGDATPRHVISEYAAEGSIAPMVMIREGKYKLNVCPVDDEQLFDLESDPHETNNLAVEQKYAGQIASMRAIIDKACNFETFNNDVMLSQKRRLVVYEALRNGDYYPWDFQPLQLASERYMRNHKDLNVLEANARFPKFEDNET